MSPNYPDKTFLSDPVCTKFEHAFRNGENPQIEDYLAEYASPDKNGLFRELLAREIKLKLEYRQDLHFQQYFHRFPDEAVIIKDLFEELVPWNDASLTLTRDPQESDTQVPDQLTPAPTYIAQYKLKSVLGTGAFGKVFLAHDTHLVRDVALKLLHPHRKNYTAMLEEARAQANIDHPHVLPIYTVEEIEKTGQFYIVSKYAAKGTLQDRLLKSTPLSVDEAVEIVIGIAKGLETCHRSGLVHRDVKPSNILFGEEDQVYLGDFGLALIESEQHSHRNRLAGSPAYMSPEQTQGLSHLLDGRSDIWSLGVIFYELLSGERPFKGKSTTDLYEEIANREPRSIRLKSIDVPVGLEQIVLKCLEKKSSKRYSLASDLITALEDWKQNKTTVDLTSSGSSSTSHEIVTSNKTGLLLGLGMICIIGFLSFMLWKVISQNEAGTKNNLSPIGNVMTLQGGNADSKNANGQLALVPTGGNQVDVQRKEIPKPVILVQALERVSLNEGIWNVLPATNTVQIYSQGEYLLPLGKISEGQRMTFQIAIKTDKYTGTSGLFFGLIPKSDSWKNYHYQSIKLSREKDDLVHVQLNAIQLNSGKKASYGIYRENGMRSKDPIIIKVTLSDRGLEDLHIDGKKMDVCLKRYEQHLPEMFSKVGIIGLWNSGGSSQFQNPVLNGRKCIFSTNSD